ncbi:unnamed protein product [Chironomus riparius]|uniref:Major facilitator superfamily (MFS) profile domain-containing protein n=1 Tax=Chironomus riparius TaxID=315576 RepID=A0A9N9RI47_9DIPT|nr:unnamed protein product [Chironomus riparius]
MGSCWEFLEFSQKMKPQGNSLAGGVMLMLVSGLQIGWIMDNRVDKLPWTEGHSDLLVNLAAVAFYASAVGGVYIAAMTINRLTKTNIYFTSLTFAIVASALLIVQPNNFYIVLLTRIMIGFAHGYSYLTIIIHASEIMHQKLRGMIIAALQVCILSSMIVTSSFAATMMEESMEAFQYVGIIGLIYCILGFIFTLIFTRESPVKLMKEKKFDEAMKIMIQVRNESSETWSIRNEYNELKKMVEEDDETTKNIFENGNTRPLGLILLLKIAFVISFNYGLNYIRLKYTSSFITQEGHNLSSLTFLTVRILVLIFTMFSIEFNGRKIHFLISHAATAVLLIAFAVLVFVQPSNFTFGYETIQFLLEVAGGIGIGVVSDVYSSEAFNTVKKTRSLCFVTAIEFILHGVIIFTTYKVEASSTFDGIYVMASGVVVLAITYLLYKTLPETAKMSIRQTRNEFLQ